MFLLVDVINAVKKLDWLQEREEIVKVGYTSVEFSAETNMWQSIVDGLRILSAIVREQNS